MAVDKTTDIVFNLQKSEKEHIGCRAQKNAEQGVMPPFIADSDNGSLRSPAKATKGSARSKKVHTAAIRIAASAILSLIQPPPHVRQRSVCPR